MSMSHDFTRDDVDHVFSDVLGKVGDPLDVTGGGEAVECRFNEFRATLHDLCQFIDCFAIESIDSNVETDDFSRQSSVEIDEGIKSFLHHGHGVSDHGRNLFRDREVGEAMQMHGSLSDVAGEIRDAFQIGVDLDDGRNPAEIDGDRLVECERLEALLFDEDFTFINRRVCLENRLDEVLATVDERAHSIVDDLFNQAELGE